MALTDKRENVCWIKHVFAILSMQPDQPQPSIPQSDSTPAQFGYSLPKTSDENEFELISCPYDSRISYERIWGANVPEFGVPMFLLWTMIFSNCTIPSVC